MTYFLDLTTYRYLSGPTGINIGWLSKNHEYSKGHAPSVVIEKLRWLAVKTHVNATRGYHTCEFCLSNGLIGSNITVESKGESRRLGSAEIWVASKTGVSYACPNLIVHYIEAHDYLPPFRFIDDLMNPKIITPGSHLEIITLSERVLAVADDPSENDRLQFYSEFARSHVGAKVSSSNRIPLVGKYITTRFDSISIPTGTYDGRKMLIVLADVPNVSKQEVGKTFIELAAIDVIKMALSQNAGIIVQATVQGRHAWVAISNEDLKQLALDSA